MRKLLLLISICLLSCQSQNKSNNYLDYSERSDKFSGGVKIIPINTPIGKFNVWTKELEITLQKSTSSSWWAWFQS